jgi:ElaB/YqjD/DUF883 family membrane-anchored ribosome-binding protein
MSTKEPSGNSFAKTATRAATLIDENVHWGADAVSNIARQTADHVERATDYVQQQGQKIKRQATELTEKATEKANDHPAYVLLAIGAMGFAIGFLLRGARTRA